jgi:hypothetical protein
MAMATILVIVLSAGVLGLLVWFEINSRRNEARIRAQSKALSSTAGIATRSEAQGQPVSEHKKAS